MARHDIPLGFRVPTYALRPWSRPLSTRSQHAFQTKSPIKQPISPTYIMKKTLLSLSLTACCFLNVTAQIPQPSSTPNEAQQGMINRGYGMFIHFGINTYSGQEWTDGKRKPETYNPTKLDTDQWAKTAKDAGMSYVILITKHHEGFCLWDSPETKYDVGSSPVKTDVVKSMAASCKKYDLKLGLYYSLWDRNWNNGIMRESKNKISKEKSGQYVDYMEKQLTELLTNYGNICELWFDGGWALPREDWQTERIYAHIKKLQPNCQIGVNWGISKHVDLDYHHITPDEYRQGQPLRYTGDFRLGDPKLPPFPDPKLYSNKKGQLLYMPFESTVTLNHQWFWHPKDKGLKTVQQLLPLYEHCTAQDNILILNSPPNRDGLMEEKNIQRFKELALALGAKPNQVIPKNLAEKAQVYADSTFQDAKENQASSATDGNPATRWAAEKTDCSLYLQWDKPQTLNFIRIREFENRIQAFTIETLEDGTWKSIAQGTTIGFNKVTEFPETSTKNLRIRFTQSSVAPSLYHLAAGKN